MKGGFLLPALVFVGDCANSWPICCLALTTSMKGIGVGPNPANSPSPDLSSKPSRSSKAIIASRRVAKPQTPMKRPREATEKGISSEKDVHQSSSFHQNQNFSLPAKLEDKGVGSNVNVHPKTSKPSRTRRTIKDPLVWIDLEMTGLDLSKDTIIEIACILTNGALDRQIEGPSIAIHHSDKVLDSMTDWCIDQHGKSGLTDKCRQSTISLAKAEVQVLSFLQQHIDPQTAHMAGNSIHVDKSFLWRHMPRLHAFLHYRIVDVSTVLEISRRWFPNELKKAPRKSKLHTAMSDIKESIEELKYYRQAIFKSAN